MEATVGDFAVIVDTFAGGASGLLGNLLTTERIWNFRPSIGSGSTTAVSSAIILEMMPLTFYFNLALSP